MTAVANPPSFPQINRSAWGSSVNQGGMNAINGDEVGRMFMPRKSAQRANSSSSITSLSSISSTSSNSTVSQQTPQTNGVPMSQPNESNNWGTAAARKKAPRVQPPWNNKSDSNPGSHTTRQPPSALTNGNSGSSMTPLHQPAPMTQGQPTEGEPMLYLLSMNGTFDHKRISVPFYPDSLRIGRQTNAKTVPSPANGFFDSKVLSRQHAEIWADRSGKIWIRDVKSSNGTFVNGARLSAENKDSDPHELQSQDHLELGIDIVSEDQKTVVHHKVAAKVEHAGFAGSTNNVLDMSFGDLNPANGSMMLPSQGPMMRGRTGSQSSMGSNGRMGLPGSVAGSQMSMMGQQRPMNFCTRCERPDCKNSDLGRADNFFGGLLSKDNVKEIEGAPNVEPKPAANGSALSFRAEGKPRFSDPPAPPPQQPLPEKPDVARSHNFDPSSPNASLRRSNTEKQRSLANGSPVREVSSQIITLVEALASAKKEIDSQSARMRDLEEMLQKERQARETAEEMAKRLELQAPDNSLNGSARSGTEGLILEDAFEPPSDDISPQEKANTQVDATGIADSSRAAIPNGVIQEKSRKRRGGEGYRSKTLAEMIEKIRSDEQLRQLASDRSRSPSKQAFEKHVNGTANGGDLTLHPVRRPNGMKHTSSENDDLHASLTRAIVSKNVNHDPLLYHSTPYVSMLGVVMVGMGLMAYLNGWSPPKADR
ncbi:FHA domain-containing protein [Botrytis cinerea]